MIKLTQFHTLYGSFEISCDSDLSRSYSRANTILDPLWVVPKPHTDNGPVGRSRNRSQSLHTAYGEEGLLPTSSRPIGLVRDMLWILAPRTVPIFFMLVRTHPPSASLPSPKPFTANDPVGSFRNSNCTLPRRADPDRQIISCGEGRGSPPQGPSGRSEMWFVDLRDWAVCFSLAPIC